MLNGHKVPKAVDFATDMYYRDLQRDISPEFMSRSTMEFRTAAGDWLAAKSNLSEALKIMPLDGPTRTLYRVPEVLRLGRLRLRLPRADVQTQYARRDCPVV